MPPANGAEALPTGAEIRSLGGRGPFAVVCANGGRAAELPGTWSASIEWLVGRIAPRFPALRFVELRYRVRSWKRLDLCVEDALAAIDAAGAARTLLNPDPPDAPAHSTREGRAMQATTTDREAPTCAADDRKDPDDADTGTFDLAELWRDLGGSD